MPLHRPSVERVSSMALQLSELPDYSGLIAATKIGVFATGGVFFLDYSRPLQPLWKPGLLIRWFRPPIGVLVPLVHEGEHSGTLLPASTAVIRATHEFMPCGRRTTHPHHNHRHTKQPHRKSLSTSKSNSRRTARNAMSNGLHRFELQWRRRDLQM